jgi:hypothetical protein
LGPLIENDPDTIIWGINRKIKNAGQFAFYSKLAENFLAGLAKLSR